MQGMNKAFVRESEPVSEYCPRCGSLGQPVSGETLDAQLRPEARRQLAESASFCPYPQCEVAYFDVFERVATVDQLTQAVYPKDPDAPLCACFGLMRDDIEQDVAEGVVTRTRAVIEKAQSGDARCTLAAANGRSCIPDVQRYYMQCRNAK